MDSALEENTSGTRSSESRRSLVGQFKKMVRSPLERYTIAVVATALAIAVRLALDPVLGQGRLAFITLFAMLVFVGWYAGLGPGLVALVLGALAAVYFILPPARQFAIVDLYEAAGLVVYLVMGAACVGLGHTLHRARRRAEENARLAERNSYLAVQREQHIREIFGSITDAFVALDKDWRFVFLNEQAEQRLGRRDLVGKNMWEEFPSAVGNEAYQQLHRAMAQRVSLDYEVFDEPWQRWFRDKAYPTADGGLTVYSQEITGQVMAEQSLRESEERLRFIADRAEVGQWHWEIEPDRLDWSPQCKRLFGIRHDELMSYEQFVAALHTDDRERTDAAVRACLESGGNVTTISNIAHCGRTARCAGFAPKETPLSRMAGPYEWPAS